MKKQLFKTPVTRQGLTRSHTITFREQGSNSAVKSFDCPKEHLEFHLSNMKSMCKDIEVKIKEG